MARFPLFLGVTASLRAAFSRWNAVFPALMVVLTVILVASGADRAARAAIVARVPFEWSDTRAAVFDLGEVWHVALGIFLVLVGAARRERKVAGGGWAVLQALIVCGLLTLFFKYATGRPPPSRTGSATDWELLAFTSRDLRVMWPSGHTSSACAAAAALTAFFDGRRWVAVLAWTIAALVAASMILLTFHWLSDVVAGGLLGFPIGRSVGRTFRAWAEDERAT
ncbi:phosphatase PAP2 family protein [bacterium]|nr:phosphatase PAP2 family protein [bacterium]